MVATRSKPKLDPRVARYVAGVLAGSIVVGRLARLAVARFSADLNRRDWDYYFDSEEAAFAIAFVESLRHSKGEWAGRKLLLSDWQAFVVANLFGWRRKADGTRRYRTAYIEVGRKNGKSTLGAAIGHKLFVGDGEEGAEVYTAATKLRQARIIHEEAKRMVRKSPGLRGLVTINRDAMSCAATNSLYVPLGAIGETEDGLNVHGAIVDEVHAHKTREMWDVLETATGSRRQPLMLGITTAGDGNDRTSICWELHSYSQKVLEGIVDDPTWFAVIYALDEARYDGEGREIASADDWTDERNWPKANPNLGVSVKLDDLRRKCLKARETPAAAGNFRRKHLNQWVSVLADWLPAGLWDANAGPETWYGAQGLLPAIRDRYRGQPCWAAADLASVDDLVAVVLAFKRAGGGVDVFPFAWCPRETAVGKSRDRQVPYLVWADAGQLSLTEGNSVDYEALRVQLRQIRDQWGWQVQAVAFDPHNARQVATDLAERDGFQVFEHRQGFLSMNDPIKQTNRLLLARKIRHGGHRVAAWCVSNVVTRTDPAGNVKFDKEKSADKIDVAVALVMAVGMALSAKAPPSFAKTGGLRSL
jgi:phage terminase large subunit-like protein